MRYKYITHNDITYKLYNFKKTQSAHREDTRS